METDMQYKRLQSLLDRVKREDRKEEKAAEPKRQKKKASVKAAD